MIEIRIPGVAVPIMIRCECIPTAYTNSLAEEVRVSAIDGARRMLADEGRVEAIVIMLTPFMDRPLCVEHGLVLIPMNQFMENPILKDQIAVVVRGLAEALRAVALLFISEVWVGKCPPGMTKNDAEKWREGRGSISEWPEDERAEALMVSFETKDINNIPQVRTTKYEILRDDDGNPRLGEKIEVPEAQGRFIGFLPYPEPADDEVN